ncbi:hypothetical protein LX32DRAFT_6968 [Colletotrichum zoysiae]|uniref:Uncharacterized protein n=1 Tax=Colletotrichum zoysiae TaxID=1216348 RepID=A0AAD9HTM2_9PEZI|nr:hypothetical protein LX32DRAFT_6968 [Colletotrichum zoysiae]
MPVEEARLVHDCKQPKPVFFSGTMFGSASILWDARKKIWCFSLVARQQALVKPSQSAPPSIAANARPTVSLVPRYTPVNPTALSFSSNPTTSLMTSACTEYSMRISTTSASQPRSSPISTSPAMASCTRKNDACLGTM